MWERTHLYVSRYRHSICWLCTDEPVIIGFVLHVYLIALLGVYRSSDIIYSSSSGVSEPNVLMITTTLHSVSSPSTSLSCQPVAYTKQQYRHLSGLDLADYSRVRDELPIEAQIIIGSW